MPGRRRVSARLPLTHGPWLGQSRVRLHDSGGPYRGTNGAERSIALDITVPPLALRMLPASLQENDTTARLLARSSENTLDSATGWLQVPLGRRTQRRRKPPTPLGRRQGVDGVADEHEPH
jgi:hypothetical protein